MIKALCVSAALATVTSLSAHAANGLNDEVQRFLSAWAGGSLITASAVSRFYEPHINYYGHTESRKQVLAEKQAIARRWPNRSYRLLPGSAHARCSADLQQCVVTAVLDWRAASGSRDARSAGAATVRLDLVRDGRVLKVARESGSVIARSRR